MTNSSPETSIVIRAFNEERWLPELFAALKIQEYRNFEVLVVDSGSIDRTRDIAAANEARIVRLRSEDFTFGYSLNIGIEQAQGALIAIISAHAIPTDAHWLERLVAPLRRSKTAMVFGGQRGHAISKFSEAKDFERIFPNRGQVMDDENVFVNNANSAIRKDLWEQHRFDEGLPGLEDAEWAKYWIPRGLDVIYEPAACVFHVHTESWAQVRHRFHREGIAGRWTAVRIIRHIPSEILREMWWTVSDYWLALLQGRLHELAGEITRYRYNKTTGIVKGILDSRVITNPSRRAELHFDVGFPAVVVRGPHSATIEPLSIPMLKPSEILVRIAYTGVGSRDLDIYEGRVGSSGAKYPIIPGHEFSGTVVSLGKKVSDFEEGDRVVIESVQGCGVCADCKNDRAATCPERRELGLTGLGGGYAEYLVTRARYAHKVPATLTLRQAALTESLATVLKGLRRIGMLGEQATRPRCAVIGASSLGYLAAQVLRLRGYDVMMLEGRGQELRVFESGVEFQVQALDRFDYIVEATGEPYALTNVLHCASQAAAILLLGSAHRTGTYSLGALVATDRVIVGSLGSTGSDYKEALTLLPQLDVSSLLQSAFPLEQFESAWAAARVKPNLKVMLRIDPNAA